MEAVHEHLQEQIGPVSDEGEKEEGAGEPHRRSCQPSPGCRFCFTEAMGEISITLLRPDETALIKRRRSPILRICILIGMALAWVTDGVAQDRSSLPVPRAEIRLVLAEANHTDADGFHVEPIYATAREQLVVSPSMGDSVGYTGVYFTRSLGEDFLVSIAVEFDERGELLWIDSNNDEDLTNDGPPRLFSSDENRFDFWIETGLDQDAGRVLFRRPPWLTSDSLVTDFERRFIDETGEFKNWNQSVFFREAGDLGTPVGFYFDDRHDLRETSVRLGETVYRLGLVDMDGNGSFADSRDLVSIPFGPFKYLNPRPFREGNYSYDEAIPLGDRRFRISRLDLANNEMYLVEVDDEVTSRLNAQAEELVRTQSIDPGPPRPIPPDFWSQTYETIHGNLIRADSLRGRYVFLSVWGEWCSVCRYEIPALLAVTNRYEPERLSILSILKTFDLQEAERLIEEYGITWPQLDMPEFIRREFDLSVYPMGILILPDGETYFEVRGVINQRFFADQLR